MASFMQSQRPMLAASGLAPSSIRFISRCLISHQSKLLRRTPGFVGNPFQSHPGGHQYGGSARNALRRRQRTAAAPSAQTTSTTVKFRIKRHIGFGQAHRVVGDHPSLGAWDVAHGTDMQWSAGDEWTTEISVAPGTILEFKIVQIGSDEAVWEGGKNHFVVVPEGAATLDVSVYWGKGSDASADGGTPLAQSSMDESSSDEEQFSENDRWGSSGNGSSSGDSMLSDDERLPAQQWAGRQPVFMQSNEHSGDRSGMWNTQGLKGAALHLVDGDQKAGNWLKKLELVKALLVDSAPAMRPDLDSISHAFVYLTWVATGALPCVESGGHHRPNHHAELSRFTFRSLEWVAAERSGTADALLARRMHARLPSFTEAFTQSVPLTRIRDIAHRNDIPHSLKQEIKHTIQNKLHRNAGPEDLVATEAMLARVTANPGEYNEAFVDEMRIFTSELRDFFNAGSLTDALNGIQSSLDDVSAQIADRFRATKAKLDADGTGADDNALMDALHAATSVRALLASGLSSGLRNDAPDKAMSMRQRWRLAEIRAEDYVFMLLSRFINNMEQRGGAGALAGGNDGAWGLPIGALVIALRHIGMCGFESAECMAIEHELAAWQRFGGLTHREGALRLRATLLRLQRLADGYCQLLLDALANPAVVLGASLGVEEERAAVFVESEIRSNVVFQLSKMTSLMLRATAEIAEVTPWDVVVAGTATGVVLQVPCLEPGCLAPAGDRDVILVVDNATGDEEIGPLGSRLKGVVVRHELPHLSHLGVRARQENVPFVTCEDAAMLGGVLRNIAGRCATLTAQPDGVTFEEADVAAAAAAVPSASGSNTAAASGVTPLSVDVERVSKLQFAPLEDATGATCGAKAESCGRLLHLAVQCASAVQQRGSGDGAPIFEAATGIALPFGCMESALKADGKADILADVVSRAETAATAATSGSGDVSPSTLAQLDTLCAEAAEIVSGVRIPQAFLQMVGGCFDSGSTVIVRSSANVEDLQGMSGAGLYDSIPNIDPKDPAALQKAIAEVWASLFTRRAVLARAAAGVPPGAAAMAVVVQMQLAPELSFVLHTAHPLTKDPSVLVAEMAPGMGETLASGTRGSAWRLDVDRQTGGVKTVAFANFSKALMPGPKGASVAAQTVDYSAQEMSGSQDMREAVGKRLAAVGQLMEAEFGGAQDVEGCVAEGRLFVVQTRPQP